jgi:hypothetical protein
MSLSKKQREQLAKAKKRHDRRPAPCDLSPAGKGTLNRMAREHTDVLQNIEFALLDVYRENTRFDDAAAMAALRGAALGETAADDPLVTLALESLQNIRAMREDITDKIWQDGLRVVMDSVHRHSTLREGETSYLQFVAKYVR